MAWTDVTRVGRALGPGVATDDYLGDCVDAANAWCYRRRAAAGYTAGLDPDTGDPIPEDPDTAPSADVAQAATLYAVALWRQRASTDSYQSFEDLAGITPTGGAMGTIRQLLGVPKPNVDVPLADGPNLRPTPHLRAAYLGRRR